MDKILDLLRQWKDYSEKGYPENLKSFGRWLSRQEQRTTNDSSNSFDAADQFKDKFEDTGFLMGMIIGYTEHWSKLAFRDLPLNSLTDFGILMFIMEKRNPTKGDVAKNSLSEKSTIFESIKRLGRSGLISEKIDSEDKRVRRVTLSEQGIDVTLEALRKANRLTSLLEGNLSQEEKKLLINILQKLNHFHGDLYHTKESAEIIESYNL